MDIDKIIEFADNILKNSDISQKRNGLVNLTKSLFKFCSVTFLLPPVSPFPLPNRT